MSGQPQLEIDWSLILRRIRLEKCVPFLGAGASLAFDGEPGLPSGAALSEKLAKECEYPGEDKWDLLRVAQYYTMIKSNDALAVRESIQVKLSVKGVQPNPIHKTIA